MFFPLSIDAKYGVASYSEINLEQLLARSYKSVRIHRVLLNTRKSSSKH